MSYLLSYQQLSNLCVQSNVLIREGHKSVDLNVLDVFGVFCELKNKCSVDVTINLTFLSSRVQDRENRYQI